MPARLRRMTRRGVRPSRSGIRGETPRAKAPPSPDGGICTDAPAARRLRADAMPVSPHRRTPRLNTGGPNHAPPRLATAFGPVGAGVRAGASAPPGPRGTVADPGAAAGRVRAEAGRAGGEVAAGAGGRLAVG